MIYFWNFSLSSFTLWMSVDNQNCQKQKFQIRRCLLLPNCTGDPQWKAPGLPSQCPLSPSPLHTSWGNQGPARSILWVHLWVHDFITSLTPSSPVATLPKCFPRTTKPFPYEL